MGDTVWAVGWKTKGFNDKSLALMGNHNPIAQSQTDLMKSQIHTCRCWLICTTV